MSGAFAKDPLLVDVLPDSIKLVDVLPHDVELSELLPDAGYAPGVRLVDVVNRDKRLIDVVPHDATVTQLLGDHEFGLIEILPATSVSGLRAESPMVSVKAGDAFSKTVTLVDVIDDQGTIDETVKLADVVPRDAEVIAVFPGGRHQPRTFDSLDAGGAVTSFQFEGPQ